MTLRVALLCSFLAGCAHRAPSTVQALPVDASRTVDTSRAVAPPASRYPVSPSSLDATAMYESYPREAREAAASGVAIVRIDLSAAGEVTDVTVLREDPAGYGFGDGCANVIRANASGWQPALDANGRPIAHRLSYRCVFELNP